MSTSRWDDATINAYVDAELDAASAARIEEDSRRDPTLAARIERERDVRARLRAEFDSVLEEPIPQRLLDALAGAGPGSVVAPIGAAGKERSKTSPPAWSRREWGALAATLVFGVLVGSLLFRGSGSLPLATDGGRFVATGYLDKALSTQLAGSATTGGAAHIGLSFRAADGGYCRTFALEAGASGLACRRDNHWGVRLLEGASSQTAGPDDFRQASSALSPAMVDAITALGAGEPLTIDEERQQIESGWGRATAQ